MTNLAKPLAVIDGQPINIADMQMAVDMCCTSLVQGKGFVFLTLNLDHLVIRRNDTRFRDAYSRADFVSADGQPLVTLAARAGVSVERTTGSDMILPLCKAASGMALPVYLFGSDTDVLAQAAGQLQNLWPALLIAGMEAPAMGFDPDSSEAEAAAKRIADSGARICFVALPSRKAVYFADRMSKIYPSIGFLGIGASLDFIAGRQSRAPVFFQKNGLEWLWRLAGNPVQMFERYFRCGLLYMRLKLDRNSSKAGL